MAIAAGPNGYNAEVMPVEGSLADLAARSGRRGFDKADATRSGPARRSLPCNCAPAQQPLRLRPRHGAPCGLARGRRQTAAEVGARLILFGAGEDRRAFDAAVIEATETIIADKTMIADSDRWFRSSRAEIEAHRDGP